MSEPQVLAALRDIHLPKAISWWPLAPGWYIVLALVLIVFTLLVYFIKRLYANGRAKRQALVLLEGFEQAYHRGENSQLTSMKVSELLRRVALVYFPREEVAGLKGKAWLEFLSKTAKGLDFQSLSDYLLLLPYQPAKKIELAPLFLAAKQWIKQRGRPCSN
ncbi:MAG: DUF4381 domain-containing protein [Tatlockia sp.]|nr:DUF4381 domain-containing protein [Tatlockia sp.]